MSFRLFPRLIAVLCVGVLTVMALPGRSQVHAVNTVQAVDISVGGEMSRGYGCAILLSNEVLCWGNSAPISGIVPGIDNAIDVSAGAEHTCALLRTGIVKCWGSNSSGQLGNGTTNASSSPVTVVGVGGSGTLSNIVQVFASAKRRITCALSSAGRVMCWGDNSNGVLGSPTVNVGSSSSTPVVVIEQSTSSALADVSTIAVGTYAACAAKSNGRAFCWGDNGLGQLGNPSSGSTNVAVPVVGVGGSGFLSDATQLALGDAMGCARRSTGAVACWGMGDLGDGIGAGSSSPVAVQGVTNAVQVASAEQNACVLLTTGDVKCWGNWHGNAGGQPTQQIIASRTSPNPVPIVTNAKQLSTGGGWPQKYCAILNDDSVRCWGANDSGSLGVSSGSIPYSNVPVEPQLTFNMGPVTTTTTTTTTTTLAPSTTVALSPATTIASGGATSGSGSGNLTQGQNAIPKVSSTTSTIPVLTTTSTTTTTVPSTNADAPEPDDVETGQGSFSKNGKQEQVVVTREGNQVMMKAGTQEVLIGLLDADGERVALNDEGTLDLAAAVMVEVSLAGFTAGDDCTVWMYSTPIKLGETKVDSDGKVSGQFEVPSEIENGDHRIVVTVGSTPADSAQFTLGVTRTGDDSVSTISRILIAVPIALAVFVGLAVPNQIRRRRKKLGV